MDILIGSVFSPPRNLIFFVCSAHIYLSVSPHCFPYHPYAFFPPALPLPSLSPPAGCHRAGVPATDFHFQRLPAPRFFNSWSEDFIPSSSAVPLLRLRPAPLSFSLALSFFYTPPGDVPLSLLNYFPDCDFKPLYAEFFATCLERDPPFTFGRPPSTSLVYVRPQKRSTLAKVSSAPKQIIVRALCVPFSPSACLLF